LDSRTRVWSQKKINRILSIANDGIGGTALAIINEIMLKDNVKNKTKIVNDVNKIIEEINKIKNALNERNFLK
jgi:hypothetical protein